jgi:hypothetical protein
MLPEHYKQWAAAIEGLSPEEQARVLGQMPEEDRLVVQRIIDQAAIGRSSAPSAEPADAPSRPPRAPRAAQAPPRRPPQRTRSAEPLPVPDSSPTEDSPERPTRASSYNLGMQSAYARGEQPHASKAASPGVMEDGGLGDGAANGREAQTKEHESQTDLLGIFGVNDESAAGRASSQASSPPAVGKDMSRTTVSDIFGSSPSVGRGTADDDDLLGGFAAPPPAAAAGGHRPATSKPQPAPGKPAASGLEELFGAQPASNFRAGDSMIDFGDEAPATAGTSVVFTSAGDVDVEGEPEVRQCPRNLRGCMSLPACHPSPKCQLPGIMICHPASAVGMVRTAVRQRAGCCSYGGSCARGGWRRSRRR